MKLLEAHDCYSLDSYMILMGNKDSLGEVVNLIWEEQIDVIRSDLGDSLADVELLTQYGKKLYEGVNFNMTFNK